jgi:hypothetical protein
MLCQLVKENKIKKEYRGVYSKISSLPMLVEEIKEEEIFGEEVNVV